MAKKFNIGWGLTNKCNMKCQFCYSKKARNEVKDCTLEDWIRFVDENHEHIDSINYGTGENSIIDDFFTFIEYVRDKYPDIKQSLTSNGYIYERIMSSHKHYLAFAKSIDEIDVSIDFYNKEKHAAFRGQPKAFDWAVNTLELCKKLNKLTTIVFVGFEETLQPDNIDGLFRIAKKYDSLVRMNIYRPVSKVPKINERFILSYKTLTEGLDYIYDNYEIVSLSDVMLGTVFAGEKNLSENTGVGSLRILPDGSIYPSTYLIDEEYKSKYTIQQGKVLDKISFPDFEHAVTPEECKGCKYEKSCNGGVFDRRVLWYGTLSERDPYCPARLGKPFPTKYYKTTKTDRVSVHDDYLTTIFFRNKSK